MKHLHVIGIAVGIAAAGSVFGLVLPQRAIAQTNPVLSNVIPQSTEVEFVATIREIDPKTRKVVLAGPTGNALAVTAGPAVRLNLLKPGDKVTGKYFRSVAFLITPPESKSNQPASPASQATLLAQSAKAPGGAAVRLTRISGVVVGIDRAAHSIDVVPAGGGGVYTIEVTDPVRQEALSHLHVGETLTAVVSEMLAVSINPVS